MINGVNFVSGNRPCCGGGTSRQENVSFQALSPEAKQKAAEVGKQAADFGEKAVVEIIKFGIIATKKTGSFLKKCTQKALNELKK